MGCQGAYATSYDFASLWCLGSFVAGLDTSLAGPNLFITDTSGVDFTASDPNFNTPVAVGMPLKNVTTGTYGYVVTVAPTILGTTNAFNPGNLYRIRTISAQQVAEIEEFLLISASDLHAALAASGACDCAFSTWGEKYLTKLNVIDAAVWHNCPCSNPQLKEDEKARLMNWVSTVLDQIVTQKLELCQGETGSAFPAVASAEQNLTLWSEPDIVLNQLLRYG